MNAILKRITKSFGGTLPLNGLFTDLETTGFKKEDDLIVQTGFCEVKDGKPLYYETVVLNWTGHPAVDIGWLRRKLDMVRQQMISNGRTWHGTTIELMREKGKDPVEALEDLFDRLYKAVKAGIPIVGHGIWQFDKSRIEFSLKEWVGIEWTIPKRCIIDTMLIEKALECGIVPTRDETAAQFFARMHGARRAGIEFNMDACILRYQFDKRYDIDLNEAHTAGFDSLCCHYLYETYRSMMEKSNGKD